MWLSRKEPYSRRSSSKYRVDHSLEFKPSVKPETPFGTITEWELSQSFAYDLVDTKSYPPQDLLAKVSWELSHKFSWPETVLYDKGWGVLYVSNFTSDGTQFISRVKLDGEIEDYEWIKGLVRPTGRKVRS